MGKSDQNGTKIEFDLGIKLILSKYQRFFKVKKYLLKMSTLNKSFNHIGLGPKKVKNEINLGKIKSQNTMDINCAETL